MGKHKGFIKKVVVGLVVVFGLFILGVMYSIWSFSFKDETVKADAAIVLGAAVWGKEPSPVFKERINHAIALYQLGYVDALLFTGGRGHEDELAESEVAEIYAIKKGVKREDIFIETASRITEENLALSGDIAKEKGFQSLLIVSDPLHMKRAILIGKDQGMNVGVSEYLVYQDNNYIGSVSSLSFVVHQLNPDSSYSFYIKARDARWNLSNASNSIRVTTGSQVIDQRPEVSNITVSPIASDGKTVSGTVALSVDALDDIGISKVEFYSSNGGYLIGTATSSPYRVNWATDPWVQDGEQILKVVAYDTINQTVETSKTVLVNNSTTSSLRQGPLIE